MNDDKIQYEYENTKISNYKENSSLYGNKLKTNIDININNNNSLKNIFSLSIIGHCIFLNLFIWYLPEVWGTIIFDFEVFIDIKSAKVTSFASSE